MLVLSRKAGERICISQNIEVKVISVQGGRVRLGISAPDNVSIHRSEIRQQIATAQTTVSSSLDKTGILVEALSVCH